MSEGMERSKAEERLIRIMTKRGGKGFLILRSAETAPKRYRRPADPIPAAAEEPTP